MNNEITTKFQLSQYCGQLNIENVTSKQSPSGFIIEAKGSDIRGNIGAVLSYVYDGHSSFKEGFCVVKKGGRYGIVDLTLKEVVAPEYQNIKDVNEGFAVASKNSKARFINMKGYGFDELPEVFDEADLVINGLARVRKDGKWGFYSCEDQKLVVPCEYQYAYEFSLRRDYTAVEKENLYGLVNKHGEVILEPVFDYINFSNWDDSFEGRIDGVMYVGGPDGTYHEK